MSNYTFKHYLNFIDLPQVGTIRISEPFGFDSSTHSINQDSKRYGRDVIIADENIEFEFTKEEFEKLATPQQLINGVNINHASQGYQYIIDCLENEGWESGIEWIIEKEGVQFVKGCFDGFTAIIGNDSVKFKVIQDTKRELVKRRDDISVDAFNNEDLDGNAITPCSTTNILLKAKPIYGSSNWKYGISTPTTLTFLFGTRFNYSNQVLKDGISNTLSYIQGYGSADDFRYIFAADDLTDVKINFSNIDISYLNGASSSRASLKVLIGADISSATTYVIDTIQPNTILPPVTYPPFDTAYQLEIPFVNRGFYVWIFFERNSSFAQLSYKSMDVDISATSTAINSVIKGVRLIDLIKNNVASISGLPTVAPIYDIGGLHYNNFAFNGYLLGQITDKPFNNKFKDLMNILQEVNADYQINPDSVEILPYSGFYTDNEMFSALQLPDHESTSTFNKRYFIKSFDYNYKKSSNQRETNTENTVDDVHGKTQWMLPSRPNRNASSDGNLKIELDHIRSAFLIEEQRRRINDTTQSKSLQYDDDLFLIDCISLAPSTKGGFSTVLLMKYDSDLDTLEILNRNQNGDGNNFDWTLLGFKLLDVIEIVAGENVGFWKVTELTPSKLTLIPNGAIPSSPFSGNAFIILSYFLTDVSFVNRTNEGFTTVLGVNGAENYSNLNYSIKRDLNYWYPYLATATKYIQNLFIKNTSFNPNGNLITRLTTESVDVLDNASISTTEINTLKFLNPIIHNVTVYAGFNEILQLMNDVRDIKGFIRVRLNNGKIIKGYIKALEYEWSTQKLELDLEEKYESDVMVITKSGNIIYVNNVGYELGVGAKNFQTNGMFMQMFDGNDVALNNPIRFTNVTINGYSFTDIDLFAQALQNLFI